MGFRSPLVRIACVALLALGVLLVSRRATATCHDLAVHDRDNLKPEIRATLVGAQLEESAQITPVGEQKACKAGAPCRFVHYRASTSVNAARPTSPEGFGPESPHWTAVVPKDGDQRGCQSLLKIIYEKGKLVPAAAAPDPKAAPDPEERLKAFKQRGSQEGRALGTSQVDASAVAAETLQILGQIVVDRASKRAFDLIKEQLQSLLGCPGVDGRTETQGHLEVGCGFTWEATCRVLESARMEDIVSSPTTLAVAVGDDVLRWVAIHPDHPATFLLPLMTNVVVPLVSRPEVMASATTGSVVDALAAYVQDQPSFAAMSPAQKSVAMGVMAFARCNGVRTSPPCDMAAEIDTLGENASASKPAARALAERLASLASGNTSGRTDRQRARIAVDTAFATACMLEAGESTPSLACPDVASRRDVTTPINTIAFAGAIADAAIAPDMGRLLFVASKYVSLRLSAAQSRQAHRALRLLGGIVDYAATYQSSGATSDKESVAKAHEQRTKVLESLTQDMTNRTGREGAWIVSFGGALRAYAGARISRKPVNERVTMHGPLSLPLGIGINHVPVNPKAITLHLQVDLFDLGNYLAFENATSSLQVKTPEVGDAFAPGLTAGFAYGINMPLVLAASFSYAPQFIVDTTRPDVRGAWNMGLTFGIHVPLLDLN